MRLTGRGGEGEVEQETPKEASEEAEEGVEGEATWQANQRQRRHEQRGSTADFGRPNGGGFGRFRYIALQEGRVLLCLAFAAPSSAIR